MDFKCVSVLSTEDLMELKGEINKTLNARLGQEAQKIWDGIITSFRALMDMGAQATIVTDEFALDDVYYFLRNKPEWEFDTDD